MVMREDLLKELARLQEAIRKSDSPYLKRDYKKACRRIKAQLRRMDEIQSDCAT